MNTNQSAQITVACLCADWCGACREYRPLFDALALKFPQFRFLWVDIEDEADLIDPIEVEDFPTILIAANRDGQATPLFFGTVLPHIETLDRLILDRAKSGVIPSIFDATVAQLAAKLMKL